MPTHDDFSAVPIPTYDEAIASSSDARLGVTEISDDAERQGLLTSRHRDLRTRVEDADDSDDDDLSLPEVTGRRRRGSGSSGTDSDAEETALRQEIEQMEVWDGEPTSSAAGRRGRHRRIRSRLSKRISSLTGALSTLQLPRLRLPSATSASLSAFAAGIPRVPRIPDEYKPKMSVLARLLGLIILAALVYAFISVAVPSGRGFNSRLGYGRLYDQMGERTFVHSQVRKDTIREYLKHLTGYDHIAGSEGSLYMGRWIEEQFRKAKLEDVGTTEYFAYLNYPKEGGREVAIVDPPEMRWKAMLEEEPVYKNQPPEKKQTPVFHGMSRSGDVTGPLIYANYGSNEDWQKLKDAGVVVNGSIALVKYYGSPGDRAEKVKIAELQGAVGCLIYSDPKDDGIVKGKEWPHGRWRTNDSVQLGSVALTSWIVGDVLTPGYASTKNAKRISKENNSGLVNIPSLPLAWRDAKKLLEALRGHGVKVPEDWVGGVPIEGWWSGDAGSPKVRLKNEQDEHERQPIFDVTGTFYGFEARAKQIIVGNHRDAWCFGAVDPGSGTAVMLEAARVLGVLRERGWQPRRTIKFASWDAEEYNLVGSTEWVEDRADELRDGGVAYINVDVGVAGPDLRADGSPILNRALLESLSHVTDSRRNKTLLASWQESRSELGVLAAGSDYVAFQDFVGTSSLDLSFVGAPGSFPYHSCYETIEWLERFGDPGLDYHVALAELLVLIVLDLAQQPVLPLDANEYARRLKRWVDELDRDVVAAGGPPPSSNPAPFDTGPLHRAADHLARAAAAFHAWEDAWYQKVMDSGHFESPLLAVQRETHNSRLGHLETHLLDIPENDEDGRGKGGKKGGKGGRKYGIPGREQFKHVLFAPSPSLGGTYDAAVFPAVRDALAAGDRAAADAAVRVAAERIEGAARRLRP